VSILTAFNTSTVHLTLRLCYKIDRSEGFYGACYLQNYKKLDTIGKVVMIPLAPREIA
jgi:hypothetical protein